MDRLIFGILYAHFVIILYPIFFASLIASIGNLASLLALLPLQFYACDALIFIIIYFFEYFRILSIQPLYIFFFFCIQ
jgi:hypothetical protein